jgi:hypothetical protein
MTSDKRASRGLNALCDLPALTPDTTRGERTRAQCHKVLARRWRLSLIWCQALKISDSLSRGQTRAISLTRGQAEG